MIVGELLKKLAKFDNELVIVDGKLYQLSINLKPFDQMDKDIIVRLKDELLEDKKAQLGLELMGIVEQKQVEQFGICRYGGFDDKPDFVGDTSNHEWFNCGRRGHCPGEGLVCKSMQAKYGKISPRMIQYLGFAVQGFTDQEAAEHMGIKASTTRTLKKCCYEAIGINNQRALISWAKDKNIG